MFGLFLALFQISSAHTNGLLVFKDHVARPQKPTRQARKSLSNYDQGKGIIRYEITEMRKPANFFSKNLR